jgi:hypothetical protein
MPFGLCIVDTEALPWKNVQQCTSDSIMNQNKASPWNST